MAPLSPPELSYLYTSLALSPDPLRPDLRSSTQFRPIIAECSILPTCNGSARICMPEAGECIVGIKAEVEKDTTSPKRTSWVDVAVEVAGTSGGGGGGGGGPGVAGISGAGGAAGRDEGDGGASVWLKEGLLAGGEGGGWSILDRLVLSKGWHWKLYIDVLLLTPTSHPSPLLLSSTLNLALDSTFLPKLTSGEEVDDIPSFSDDWALATRLYPAKSYPRPPISLPVIAVGDNMFLDPSQAEVAVAEVGMVVTILLADARGNADVTGVRSMEVGRGGSGDNGRKGMSRSLLKRMVEVCIGEGVDMTKALGDTCRTQLEREGW